MAKEYSVYELNRIQQYIMQMRPVLKKEAAVFGWNKRLPRSDGTGGRRKGDDPFPHRKE